MKKKIAFAMVLVCGIAAAGLVPQKQVESNNPLVIATIEALASDESGSGTGNTGPAEEKKCMGWWP